MLKKQVNLGNRNDINNPFRLVCNNWKCLYRGTLIKFSFLGKISTLPASIILEKFIIEQNNASKITSYINDYYGIINKRTIDKILKWLRTAFDNL